MEAGIRNRVEIWADGGYRHAHDVVKLHCMGANRVAFGTLAMVSLGCTICRGCQLDTCHVGIATQIETVEQATEHGLKKFTPQRVDSAAENCARFFASMGEEVKQVVAGLGYERAQDLVGRYDLLEQVAHAEQLDLAELITPLEEFLDLEPIDLPVAEEELVEARAEAGLVRARPIRMQPKQASAELAGLAGKVFAGEVGPRAVPAPDRRPRPRARHRAGRGDLPCPDLRGRARRAIRSTCWRSSASTAARSPARASAPSTPGGSWCGSRAAPRTASARRCWAAPSRSSRARTPRGAGSTARWASRSPTAPSVAACSCRGRPTRASASASRAPTWCWRASRPSRWTTHAAASSTAPTPRASPSST